MSKTMRFPEVTRLYTPEIFRLRYSRRARATERAPRSILHRVHKSFFAYFATSSLNGNQNGASPCLGDPDREKRFAYF